MKKIIRVCSLLSILVLSSVFTVTANSGFGTEVEIPFAFNVGDRAYDAGHYIIKLGRLSSGSATLSIQNSQTDEVQIVLVNANQERTTGDTRLVFDTIDGKKYLTKVRNGDRSFALIKTKADKNEKVGIGAKPAESAAFGGAANLF